MSYEFCDVLLKFWTSKQPFRILVGTTEIWSYSGAVENFVTLLILPLILKKYDIL